MMTREKKNKQKYVSYLFCQSWLHALGVSFKTKWCAEKHPKTFKEQEEQLELLRRKSLRDSQINFKQSVNALLDFLN